MAVAVGVADALGVAEGEGEAEGETVEEGVDVLVGVVANVGVGVWELAVIVGVEVAQPADKAKIASDTRGIARGSPKTLTLKVTSLSCRSRQK